MVRIALGNANGRIVRGYQQEYGVVCKERVPRQKDSTVAIGGQV
jgi:hypothetical protein